MKKLTFVLIAVLAIAFSSCEKKEIEEAPGNIPGMGEAAGELQVEAFELPEGIELVGNIAGINDEVARANSVDINFKTTQEAKHGYSRYGSGGIWIEVLLTLKNTTNAKQYVLLPAGLIFKVNKKDYQHGILLGNVIIPIEANSSLTLVVQAYCINKGRHSSDPTAQFTIHGVTLSNPILRLLNKLGWKKINIEDYDLETRSLKSASDDELTYDEIVKELQEAVWSITNGDGLTNEQIEFINNLPEKE